MKLDLVVEEPARPWPPAPEWTAAARTLVTSAGPKEAVLEVILTGDDTLRRLNHEFRGKDTPTDVLSFSHLSGHEPAREPLLRGREPAAAYCQEPHPVDPNEFVVGQVYVSLETVRRRPLRSDWTISQEVLFLIAHGVLHVLGYDHVEDEAAAEMEARERELMARIGIAPGAAVTGGEGS